MEILNALRLHALSFFSRQYRPAANHAAAQNVVQRTRRAVRALLLLRTVYGPTLKEFEPPKTAAELRDILAQSIIEIRNRKLDPKLANSISYLGTGFLRALEVSDLEARLLALETHAVDSKSETQS
jgi:hypothetical protein